MGAAGEEELPSSTENTWRVPCDCSCAPLRRVATVVWLVRSARGDTPEGSDVAQSFDKPLWNITLIQSSTKNASPVIGWRRLTCICNVHIARVMCTLHMFNTPLEPQTCVTQGWRLQRCAAHVWPSCMQKIRVTLQPLRQMMQTLVVLLALLASWLAWNVCCVNTTWVTAFC